MIRVNRLIINADDFGIHEAVNEGIYSAYGQGVLTSTSLLAQGPAFDDAVRMSKECNRLGIGIHLWSGRGVCLPYYHLEKCRLWLSRTGCCRIII